MRFTLVTMAFLAGTALSAHAAAGKASSTVTKNVYGCFDPALTADFYRLAAASASDADSKLKLDAWVRDAMHSEHRPCRFFDKAQVIQEIIPDAGTGYACVSDQNPVTGDKPCYWIQSSGILKRS